MARTSTHDHRAQITMAVLLAMIVAVTLCSPNLIRAQPPHVTPAISVTAVAEQLGVSLAGNQSGELVVGVSFTGTANDPAKLEALGIRGAHKGARVTVARIAQEVVLVEVDELDPKPLRLSVRLKLGADGSLSR